MAPARRRTLRLALGAALAALAVAAVAVPPVAGPGRGSEAGAQAAPAATSSAVTVRGQGRFADLEVTVSQTQNLANQAVTVSWTGAPGPTIQTGRYGANYLQIMQCWGDEEAGPERDQCQWGARGTVEGGENVGSRALSLAGLRGPSEAYDAEGAFVAGVNGVVTTRDRAYVQFRSVTGEVFSTPWNANTNPFTSYQTTNELHFGRTMPDGTGEEIFEVQTDREAPGLGCGLPVEGTDPVRGRRCWLVVVPRDQTEIDGRSVTGTGISLLASSPLALDNWSQRLQVPLDFDPVGTRCPVGAAERRTAGSELVVEAMSSWQPVLCAGGGAAYNLSQVADGEARRQLTSGLEGAPGMVFLSRPVPSAEEPPDRPVTYAPLVLSGVTIGFHIERQVTSQSPPEVAVLRGTRIPEINLTPRLVAKLLTQSYRAAVPGGAAGVEEMAANPEALTLDPEFVEHNPEWVGLLARLLGTASPVVGAERSDAVWELWRWLDADPDARAFLDGEPDEFGMRVNPHYAGLERPRDDLPKADPTCQELDFTDLNGAPVRLCTLELAPYASDLHDAARSARRGDSLAQGWDPLATPPTFKDREPQLAGKRQLLAVTDTSSAARYGVQLARLRNAAGQFVAPDQAGLVAGAAAMAPTGVDGVSEPDPAAGDPAAYPLAMVTYAAVAPAAIDADAGRDYAELVRYGVGAGQEPGSLPGQLRPGYAPLPEALRAQARAAADRIEADAGKPVDPGTTTTTTTTTTVPPGGGEGPVVPGPGAGGPVGLAGPPASLGTGTGLGSGLGPGPAGAPPAGGAPVEPLGAAPGPVAAGETDELEVASARTPGLGLGAERFAVLVVVAVGLVALAVAGALRLVGRGRASSGGVFTR